MENVTITLAGPGVQETQEFNIQVSIAAIIQSTPVRSRIGADR